MESQRQFSSSLKNAAIPADLPFSHTRWPSLMKVYDRNLAGASAAGTGRTAETQSLSRSTESAKGATSKGDGDRVELSSTLGKLSRALRAYSEQHSPALQALAAQVQSGQYKPDPLTVSQKMIAETIAASAR